MVYVLNKHGKPLMPCNFQKARVLLKKEKAKVVRNTPFTIQLLYGSTGYKQEIVLGVDSGSKTIGLSATTETKEVFSAEVTLRNDVSKLIQSRRESRRNRRNRKTRYRQVRYLNRKRPKGWIAPSIQNKIDSHLRIIKDVHKILPISKTIVEVASFDIQKIQNPNINSIQYQQGPQFNFWNVREYVFFRDGHKCVHCKGKKDRTLNVHHIESRLTGGNAPNNLVTLCETCHKLYHSGQIQLKLKRGKIFKDAAFMGIMRWYFYNQLRERYSNVSLTYGYITKTTRIDNNLPKTHNIDAFCITENVSAKRMATLIKYVQVRKKKRSLHEETARKGRTVPNTLSKRNEKNSKEIITKQGKWCLWDKVLLNGKVGYISGFSGQTMAYVQNISGEYLQVSNKYKQVNLSALRLVERNNTWIYEVIKNI